MFNISWSLNEKDAFGNKIHMRLYKAHRIFNLIFSYEDLQKDYYGRITIIVAGYASQLVIPFRKDIGIRTFRWSLVR